jgi:hypothetical protein
MKSLIVVSVLLGFAAAPALAEEPASGGAAVQPLAGEENCVEVEIGGETTPVYSCLNQRLQRLVDRVKPGAQLAPLDATSPGVKVGGFSQTGVVQQYGSNFGKSVVPFRPAPQPSGNVLRP